jgi:hypothetical protein
MLASSALSTVRVSSHQGNYVQFWGGIEEITAKFGPFSEILRTRGFDP